MTQILYRAASINQAAIDVQARTVELAFSSEYPVQRSFGIELLSHNPADVDLSFLNSGNAPLLLEHEQEDQIGVIERAAIDADGVGRALVRFSKSTDGDEVFQDVIDGIRKNVSVGYVITGKRVEQVDGEQVCICSWLPKEISIVAIPADTTVGIGRSDELVSDSPSAIATTSVSQNATESRQGSKEITKNQEAQRGESIKTTTKDKKMENTKQELDAVRSETIAVERARISEITTLAKRHGAEDIANQFVSDGRSVEEFRAAVLDHLASRPQVNTASSVIGMSDKEQRSYSLARAINAIVTGDFSDAGLELEASRAVAKAQGKVQTRSSIFVPGEYLTRAAGANAVSAAGNAGLVNHTKVGFMDVLFNNTISQRLGVQYLGGLNGVIELPKFTNAAQARFVDEGVDGTIDAIHSDVVTLSPRTVVALAELTRSMILNGTAMESRIQAHLQKAVATKIDAAVFEAILAETGINWATLGVDGLDYAAIRELIKNVEVANALTDSAYFAFNPVIGNALSSTPKGNLNPSSFVRADDGSVAGYQTASSNHVGNNIIFGDYSNVTVGNWSTLELAVDTSQKFLSGGFLLRAITDVDVAVTRPEAFSGYKNVI